MPTEYRCPTCEQQVVWYTGIYGANEPSDAMLICFKCHKILLINKGGIPVSV